MSFKKGFQKTALPLPGLGLLGAGVKAIGGKVGRYVMNNKLNTALTLGGVASDASDFSKRLKSAER